MHTILFAPLVAVDAGVAGNSLFPVCPLRYTRVVLEVTFTTMFTFWTLVAVVWSGTRVFFPWLPFPVMVAVFIIMPALVRPWRVIAKRPAKMIAVISTTIVGMIAMAVVVVIQMKTAPGQSKY